MHCDQPIHRAADDVACPHGGLPPGSTPGAAALAAGSTRVHKKCRRKVDDLWTEHRAAEAARTQRQTRSDGPAVELPEYNAGRARPPPRSAAAQAAEEAGSWFAVVGFMEPGIDDAKRRRTAAELSGPPAAAAAAAAVETERKTRSRSTALLELEDGPTEPLPKKLLKFARWDTGDAAKRGSDMGKELTVVKQQLRCKTEQWAGARLRVEARRSDP